MVERTKDDIGVFERVLRMMIQYGFDFDFKSYDNFGEERPSAWDTIISNTEYQPGRDKAFYLKQQSRMRVIIEKFRKKFELYRFLDHINTSLMILLLDESQSEEQKKPLIDYLNDLFDMSSKELFVPRKCFLFHLHHHITKRKEQNIPVAKGAASLPKW